MLPNHSPLVVAEQFGTLESLFPGRIDLGLGRAPGTDRETMLALRRDAAGAENDFPVHVQELRALLGPPSPGQRVHAIPGEGLARADLAAGIERIQRAARRPPSGCHSLSRHTSRPTICSRLWRSIGESSRHRHRSTVPTPWQRSTSSRPTTNQTRTDGSRRCSSSSSPATRCAHATAAARGLDGRALD
jgi:hypothetical protein